MKVEPDGKIFIQGKETTDSKEIARALYAFGMSLGEERDKLKQENASLTYALDLAVGALEECRTTLSHACVFIASRQKMYKDGIEWHNKCEDKVKEALTAIASLRGK